MEILMVRPYQFYYNKQTAVNNFFQSNCSLENIPLLAITEFDRMVEKLRAYDIKVIVIQDTPHPATPDSIFPNNWFSTHSTGILCLYPMYAPNRRAERKSTVIDFLQTNYIIKEIKDLSYLENQGKFLEGTGSMVLDHKNKIAYGCLSERLHEDVFKNWCYQMNFQPISFRANDSKGQPIYHTNVMMCISDSYVVICLQSIIDKIEKQKLVESLLNTQKQIIEISHDQLYNFAGNMLQVFNQNGKPYLVLSETAFKNLKPAQLDRLEKLNPLLPISIPTIEAVGGGSTRCMMAEIYLEGK